MKILLVITAMFCFGMMPVISIAAEFDLSARLESRVTYNFDGETLEEVVRKVSQSTNLNIIPLKSALQSVAGRNKIYLSVSNMKLRQFLDWLAGSINARYRIFPDGRVYLSQNYEWVEVNKFGMIFFDLEDIISGAQELEQFDSGVGEISKVISLFDDNYYIRIEEQGDMTKLVAHIPKDLKPVFLKLFALFASPGEKIADIQPVAAVVDRDELEIKLASVREVNYPYMPLNSILERLAVDFGVNIGCVNSVYNEGGLMPEISLKLGSVSLKEALEVVIEKTSLQGVEYSLPGGLWLTDYPSDWQEMVERSFLWSDSIEMRSYNIDEINLHIPGETVAQEIIRSIAKRAWYDPLASVLYHKKSGNLIVIADDRVQNKVLVALKDLELRLTGAR